MVVSLIKDTYRIYMYRIFSYELEIICYIFGCTNTLITKYLNYNVPS